MTLSLSDAEFLAATKEALQILMKSEKPDRFGRYSPTVERLKAAIAQQDEAARLHEKFGDDH